MKIEDEDEEEDEDDFLVSSPLAPMALLVGGAKNSAHETCSGQHQRGRVRASV
jgi:hypothetical protein